MAAEDKVTKIKNPVRCESCKKSQLVKTIYYYTIGDALVKYCYQCAIKLLGKQFAASGMIGWKSGKFSGGMTKIAKVDRGKSFQPWKPNK